MITLQAIGPPVAEPAALDDPALVRMARQDLAAFSLLYRRHLRQVYHYLLARTGNVEEAQDLTSQTFMAAMQNLAGYRDSHPFIAWLLGIARNKAVDHYRRGDTAAGLAEVDEVVSGDDPLEEIVGRRLELELVARKLRTLAPDRAEALALRLFAGLEVGEIAAIMDRNEAAVRMLVFRGLRDLHQQLQGLREER